MFVNDMDQSVLGKLLKFADDTKLYRCISDPGGVDMLKDDLRSLYQWSEEWQMLFNADKCKVMHFGNNNAKENYSTQLTIQF